MELLQNGIMTASVYYEEDITGESMSRNRAIILHLSEGDELTVRIPAGYLTYSWTNTEEFTVFTGFRISP